MTGEPTPLPTAAPSQPTSQQPEGLRTMLEVSNEAGPKQDDPKMKPAFDRFHCLEENLAPTSPEARKNAGNLSISHLPPDVQARVLARSAVANEAKARYWAYVAEQDAKETPVFPEP